MLNLFVVWGRIEPPTQACPNDTGQGEFQSFVQRYIPIIHQQSFIVNYKYPYFLCPRVNIV